MQYVVLRSLYKSDIISPARFDMPSVKQGGQESFTDDIKLPSIRLFGARRQNA